MKKVIFISIISSVLFLFNCQSSKQITTYSNLSMLEVGDNLQIVTVDTTIYDVKNFTFTDSSINIEGKRNKNDRGSNFKGELDFSEIAYMQTQEAKVFQTLVFATLTSAIIISGGSNSWGNEGITPTIKFQSGGSCPYVYSWNGDKYILEGEAL